SASIVTSPGTARTLAPVAALILSAASRSAASVRADIVTLAPSAASSIAVARPSPLDAPATSAVFPFNPRSMRFLHFVINHTPEYPKFIVLFSRSLRSGGTGGARETLQKSGPQLTSASISSARHGGF